VKQLYNFIDTDAVIAGYQHHDWQICPTQIELCVDKTDTQSFLLNSVLLPGWSSPRAGA